MAALLDALLRIQVRELYYVLSFRRRFMTILMVNPSNVHDHILFKTKCGHGRLTMFSFF